MSLPSDCHTALATLNEIGGRLKLAKTNGTDTAPLLAEYNVAKTALDTVVRPIAEAAKEANPDFFWNVLAPCFERVMDKSEKKKHDKDKKKRKKALAAGGGAAAPATATPAAPAPNGEKKISKKEQKRLDKAKKKAVAIAKKKAEQQADAAAASAVSSSSSSSSSSSTSRTPSSGTGRASKSRRLSGSTAALAPALTAPLPQAPRTPVAGMVDPARCPFPSALRLILLAAKTSGHDHITLGRFQQQALFMDVPSYDVGDGTVLSGTATIVEYCRATATPTVDTTNTTSASSSSDWSDWCTTELRPCVSQLLPPVRSVGVVFASVVATQRTTQVRARATTTLRALLARVVSHPPPATDALPVALRLDDVRTSCGLDGNRYGGWCSC